MTITSEILQHLKTTLEKAMITDIDADDPTRAGAVKIGPLQGEPDVDVARISIEIHPNDPDDPEGWQDEIVEWEMPRTAIWARRFTIIYRALLTDSGEELDASIAIISTIKARLEETLNTVQWGAVAFEKETVMGCPLDRMLSEISQGGGPGEYDWSGKIGFDLETNIPYR